MNFIALDKIPDVSFYQDDNTTPQQIDFVKMKILVNGVIIRAGQNTWIDPDFKYNWQKSKEAGLKRGAYWFYDPRSEPVAQAKLFTDLFKSDPPEYGLWCDYEYTWDGTYKGETNCKKFQNNVESNFGKVVGIYTANWWWNFTDDNYWSTRPLWVAQYTTLATNVTLPSSWRNKGKNAVLWQFTSKADGSAHGVESLGLDMNYTSQAFYDLFPIVEPSPPSPPPTEPNTRHTVINISVDGFQPVKLEFDLVSTDTPTEPPPNPTPIYKYDGWRVLHKHEGGWPNTPLDKPEVMPPANAVAINMTDAIQVMSFDLMKSFNSAITDSLWTNVHGYQTAFNNFNGFKDPDDPRRNYIKNENTSSPLPKYDKAQRLCGGTFIRADDRGDGYLYCVPGIHGIDANKPMPSIEKIIENNWYLDAITVYFSYDKIGYFPQGKGGRVVIPFIFDREIKFEKKYFQKWQSDTLPDPLKFYSLSLLQTIMQWFR